MRFLRSKKKSSQPDDILLAEYRLTGNPQVMEVLFDRYSHLAFAVCMKYLKDEEDSKDAVLHIFERMHSDLLRYEVQRFSHWLYVLTRNYCLKQLKAKTPTSGLESIPAEEPGDDEPMLDAEMLRKLDDALSALNEGQRLCIRLFYLEERTYQEIASTTGYDIKLVKSHIQNGKRNLRNFLTRHGNA